MLLLTVLSLAIASSFDHSHAAWTAWLKTYAKVEGPETTVNYKLAKADLTDFDAYIRTMLGVSKADYDSWNEKDRLAFLINAYNALTIQWIFKNYPIKSIKDTGSLFSSAWKKKFFTLLGEEQHLDNIEHDRIRKEFNEPRIHFAVVCASKGCPALRGEAYTGSKLDTQLEDGARLFLNDKGRNRFESSEKTLYLSKIFDWYGDDFKKAAGSVAAFVAPRMGISREISSGDELKVKFLDYDWSLNETP